jgi:hypothetical protein
MYTIVHAKHDSLILDCTYSLANSSLRRVNTRRLQP